MTVLAATVGAAAHVGIAADGNAGVVDKCHIADLTLGLTRQTAARAEDVAVVVAVDTNDTPIDVHCCHAVFEVTAFVNRTHRRHIAAAVDTMEDATTGDIDGGVAVGLTSGETIILVFIDIRSQTTTEDVALDIGAAGTNDTVLYFHQGVAVHMPVLTRTEHRTRNTVGVVGSIPHIDIAQ